MNMRTRVVYIWIVSSNILQWSIVLADTANSCGVFLNCNQCTAASDGVNECFWCGNRCVSENENEYNCSNDNCGAATSVAMSFVFLTLISLFTIILCGAWFCMRRARVVFVHRSTASRVTKLPSFAWGAPPCCTGNGEANKSCPACLGLGCSGPRECAVCLCDFQSGQEIRRLPCKHLFHLPCIDTWLDGGKSTCPLCVCPVWPERLRYQDLQNFGSRSRAPMVSNTAVATSPDIQVVDDLERAVPVPSAPPAQP